MKKKIGLFIFSVIVIGVSKYVYDVHLNYNFKEISENKVYKSGVIPPEKIATYIQDHQINSVIDLRFPHTRLTTLKFHKNLLLKKRRLKNLKV
jgi:hypothetical protein